jgi:hypothetical protein
MHRRAGSDAPGATFFVDGRFYYQLIPIDFGVSIERRCIAVATALRNEWEFFSMTAVKLNGVIFATVRHCSISP